MIRNRFRKSIFLAAFLAAPVFAFKFEGEPNPDPNKPKTEPDPKPNPAPKEEKPAVAFKTQKDFDDEVQRRLQAERDEQKRKDEEKKAKEAGDHQKIIDARDTTIAELQLENKKNRAANELLRRGAKKYPELVGAMDEFVLPAILISVTKDSKDEDVNRIIDEKLKAYADAHKGTPRNNKAPPAKGGKGFSQQSDETEEERAERRGRKPVIIGPASTNF